MQVRACLVAAMLFSPLPALAQVAEPTGQQFVFANLDYPHTNTVVPRSRFFFSGWAMTCGTRQQPTLAFAYYLADADAAGVRALVRVPLTVLWRVYRPDVAGDWTPRCGALSDYLGFHAYFDAPVPLGRRQFVVYVTDPDYSRTIGAPAYAVMELMLDVQ
jgi:hypothetical protein